MGLGRCVALFAVVVHLVGCGSSARPEASRVEVVNIAPRLLDSLPTWSLDTPLQIGDRTDPATWLELPRSPRFMSDGRIVVVNASRELRFYDSDGRPLATVGRLGDGPGEYRQIWSVLPVEGDSLLVLDLIRGISVRDSNGRFVRSYRAQSIVTPPFGWMADRTMVYLDPRGSRSDANVMRVRGTSVIQDTNLLIRSGIGGGSIDTLDRLPGEWWRVSGGSLGGLPLSGDPFLATGADQIVAGHGGVFELRWYDRGGALVRISRVLEAPRRVTPEDIGRYERHEAIQARSRRLPVEVGPRPDPRYAETLPLMDQAVIDRDGNAWVRRWVPADEAETWWVVFGADGYPKARLAAPRSLRVSDIVPGHLLGVYRDENRGDFVRRYHVRRGARPGGDR